MNKLLYGVAYYDEYMPCDRLAKDVEMMKAAGINLVRIAESTWSTCEPQEGVFDFSPQQHGSAHIPAGQTARAGPGGKPADKHRRRGKHGYVPEKAPHRPLPECQPHSIPRGPEQAAEP